MNRPRYCVGIDPGKTTGVAVYDRHEKKFSNVMSTSFWGCYDYFYASNIEDFDVIIELPRTKISFRKTSSHTESVNVGMVYRESELLAEGLERLGYSVKRVHPTGAGKRLDDKQVRAMTGWDKQTNQHTRDAMMICYGK